MAKISDISAYLSRKIPPELKEDYDNVGLLCGFPENDIRRVLVALDVTLETIREAESLSAELIVAHHPVIFTPLSRVLDNDLTGRRVIRLIQSGISAVCMHTNLDRLEGGVNTALAFALGTGNVRMLDMGCTAELPHSEPIDLSIFLSLTKKALGADDIRYYNAERPVKHIAICGGAGGEIMYEAARLGCDTILTGEIKHHQWIDGRELGLNLIEAGHFATENVVLPALAEMLRQGFPELEINLSEQGPLTRGWTG